MTLSRGGWDVLLLLCALAVLLILVCILLGWREGFYVSGESPFEDGSERFYWKEVNFSRQSPIVAWYTTVSPSTLGIVGF